MILRLFIFDLFISCFAILAKNVDAQFQLKEMRTECSSQCVQLKDCSHALRAFKDFSETPTTCYFEGTIPYICCAEVKLKTCPYHPISIHNRIIHGNIANPADFPFMVGLSWDTPLGDYYGCGGTLIHKHFVLTAAHCLYNNKTYRPLRYAVVGGGSIRRGKTPIRIVGVMQHPGYRPTAKNHDIAILRLEDASPYPTACLPRPDEEIATGTTVIAAGYGRTSYFGDISDVLLRADLEIYEQSACTEFFGSLADGQLCALSEAQLLPNRTIPVHSDTCQGDSGGPLIQQSPNSDIQSVLIGVVSFGFPCGNGYPGVYTRVSKYYDWINSKIYPR